MTCLPADEIITATHEQNWYFWEGLVHCLASSSTWCTTVSRSVNQAVTWVLFSFLLSGLPLVLNASTIVVWMNVNKASDNAMTSAQTVARSASSGSKVSSEQLTCNLPGPPGRLRVMTASPPTLGLAPDVTFESFVATHQVRLRRYALALTGNGHDSDDLFQTTLITLYLVKSQISRAIDHLRDYLGSDDPDDLIRTSLRVHTSAAAPDDALGVRMAAIGRRIHRTRTAGVAALAVVTVLCVVWGSTVLPGRTQQGIAAGPSPNMPTSIQPTPSESATSRPTSTKPTFSSGGTVRDVSKVGEPAGYPEAKKHLESFFASPSGNFLCTMSTVGARCTGTWDKGVEPLRKICDVDGVVEGVQVDGAMPAAWFCGSDAQSFPFLNGEFGDGEGGHGVDWWDPTFGESIPFPVNPSLQLAVLPYGKTLVAGVFTCFTATVGVTRRSTLSGNGFLISRSRVDLQS